MSTETPAPAKQKRNGHDLEMERYDARIDILEKRLRWTNMVLRSKKGLADALKEEMLEICSSPAPAIVMPTKTYRRLKIIWPALGFRREDEVYTAFEKSYVRTLTSVKMILDFAPAVQVSVGVSR